jgi:hypothetical protein
VSVPFAVSLEAVYIKGCSITFIILPDFLAYSPMFRRVSNHKKGIRSISIDQAVENPPAKGGREGGGGRGGGPPRR